MTFNRQELADQAASLAAAVPKKRTFVFANNRMEGNALSTIAAMMPPA